MRSSALAVTIVSSIILAAPAASQSDVENRAAALSQELLKLHTSWTKISSNGASVEVREISRRGRSGKDLVVQYHLFVKGLPQEKLYQYLNWPINQSGPQTALAGISIGKEGLLMCAGRTPEQCGDASKKDDPIEFTFVPAKAEPYRVAIAASNDPDLRVAVIIVPDPIEGKDKGCSLTVVRLLPKFELAYLEGSGFPAKSEVAFDTQSFGEKHTATAKTNENGELSFALMPFVAGRSAGTTQVRALGNCSPALSFDWGK
jgi:hypothetical protein